MTLLGVSSDYGDSDNDVDGDDQNRREHGGQKGDSDQGVRGSLLLVVYRVQEEKVCTVAH